MGDSSKTTPPGQAAPLDKAARARLRELCEAATPGPWEAGRAWVNAPREFWIQHDDGSVSNTIAWLGTLNGANREGATAALIAAARNALPALLDALDAAEVRAERAEAFPSRCAFCEARTEATSRAAAEHIAGCEKHPLRAAVDENMALRSELARGARCDTPDCQEAPIVGLCWNHAVIAEVGAQTGVVKEALRRASHKASSLADELEVANQWQDRAEAAERALATHKACLEAEVVERQKAESERDAMKVHIDAAGEGMNLLALLDMYHGRALRAERKADALREGYEETESAAADEEAAHTEALDMLAAAQHRAATAESALAALRAEADGMRIASLLDAALIAETAPLKSSDTEGVIASHEWWLGLAEGRRVAARFIRSAAEAAAKKEGGS